MDKFTYLGSSVSSTENYINTPLAKVLTAIDRLSVMWKSDLSNKIKYNFLQEAVMSVLLYGGTTWMLTKCMEKKLDSICTRMLQAILNKSWRQHPIKQHLYGHPPPVLKTIQIRQTRHVGRCWRSKDKLISDIFLWTPSHGWTSVGWPVRTYLQQFCLGTGCSLEDLPEAVDERDKWRERVREIHASDTTWWWLYWHLKHWYYKYEVFTYL